jgi:hypothetical protein
MASKRWSIGRVLLIWCAWPVLLFLALVVVVTRGAGFSLDLLHPSGWPLVLAVLFGPPLGATLAWGRR